MFTLPSAVGRYWLASIAVLLLTGPATAAEIISSLQGSNLDPSHTVNHPSRSLAQSPSGDRPVELLFETQGVLESGDGKLEDGSYRDVHSFVGTAGQQVTITVASPDFDTFLALIAPDGRGIKQNSDIDWSNTNSAIIAFTLPQSGTYQIVVNSYDPKDQGRYQLKVYDVSNGAIAPLPDSQPETMALQAQQLMQLGFEQVATGQVETGLDNLQQALKLFETEADLANQGLTLFGIGSAFDALEQYQSAITAYEKALPIFRQIGDRQGERNTLNNLGETYFALGQYRQAQPVFERALALTKQDNDAAVQADVLNNLGVIYDYLGKYQEAIKTYQQALAIHEACQDRSRQAKTLNNLGSIYRNLGQYQRALDYYEQSQKIRHEIGDPAGESRILNNIAETHRFLGQQQEKLGKLAIAEQEYQQALPLYQEALKLAEIAGDHAGQVSVLNNLGTIYGDLKQYEQEQATYEQALAIAQEIGTSGQIALLQNNLGTSAEVQGRHQEALKHYQRALVKFRETGDRDNEATTLSNIGSSLNDLNELELAIAFLKQSINVREEIRRNVRTFSREAQHSYKEKATGSYQRLSTLLLEQNRVMEALLVLDLLKVQELQDFLKNVEGNQNTAQGIELLPQEKQIFAALESDSNLDINTYLQSTPVKALIQEIHQTAPAQNLKLSAYKDLQTRLSNLGQNSALFYPLVRYDSLELVLFTRNAPPIHRSVPISKSELEKVVTNFRAEIQNTTSDAIQEPAKQLYQLLINPIADQLQQQNIQTIIYAPDGQMRYVPLAALYDGEQWLVEKYQINYITALSLTDLDTESFQNPSILAGAFTEPRGQVNIDEQTFDFGPIPSARREVESLAATFPNTKTLIGKAFNRTAITTEQMNRHNIVHLATHGQLVSGNPEDSFILLNNQEYITLREIKDWQLPNVGLVVLSACQTALGDRLGSGIEIIGFGYQLQQAQARASIATLWSINDAATSDLMNEFYAQISQGSPNPVNALRDAQIALIQGNLQAERKTPRVSLEPEEATVPPEQQLKHPYYWAPFILIGNGF